MSHDIKAKYKNQVVEITGQHFRVVDLVYLGQGEVSLVGYWLLGGFEPEVPNIVHVMVPVALITLVKTS